MASESSNRAPNGFLAFLGGVVLFFGVAVVAIGALALSRPTGETVEQMRAAKRLETAARLEKEAQEKLTLGWVDKAKGVARAPIADVMPMVVAELKARKPAPSQVKVEPPLPMPVIDPKATEPPPPALTSAPQGADTIRFAPPASVEPTAPALAPTTPAPAATPPAPAPAATPPPPAPPAPAPQPATNPTPPAPVPVTPPAPAPAAPPPPAPTPTTPPEPATPAPAPVANPTTPPAPRPPIINPTENSEPTK